METLATLLVRRCYILPHFLWVDNKKILSRTSFLMMTLSNCMSKLIEEFLTKHFAPEPIPVGCQRQLNILTTGGLVADIVKPGERI